METVVVVADKSATLMTDQILLLHTLLPTLHLLQIHMDEGQPLPDNSKATLHRLHERMGTTMVHLHRRHTVVARLPHSLVDIIMVLLKRYQMLMEISIRATTMGLRRIVDAVPTVMEAGSVSSNGMYDTSVGCNLAM